MPLVDLQTDLTSLKFGKDRPGGGSSREPFITGKSLDKRIKGDGIETLARTGGPDMFIRGGLQVASSVADDLVRLGKYFTTVKGGLFFAQQNLLSATGTRIYGGYPLSITGPNSSRLNDGVYTPLSTLAAATGIAFGAHPNKQGIDFTGSSTTLSRPEYINLVDGNFEGFQIEAQSIKNIKNNRLVNLYDNKIATRNGSTDTELFSYKGGPGAGARNGLKTVIKASSDRTLFSGRGGSNFSVSYSTLDTDQLLDPSRRVGDSASTLATDFRKDLRFKPESFISSSPSYSGPEAKNIEKRVNLGDPGKRAQNRSDYSKGNPNNKGGLDKINSLYLYRSTSVTRDSRKNDLIKFRIATIDNTNPRQAVFTHFRAFINSFSDSMGADWNSFRYTGRGDNFYTYQGFNNTISLSYTVAVQSVQELSIVYKKLNYLKSTLAPDYSGNGYMKGNIHKLTLGGYFYETPGIIESLTYTVPQDSPYEIGLPSKDQDSIDNSPGGIDFRNPKVKELPLIVNVDMTFKPIYKFLPATVTNIDGSTKKRFISLENDFGASLYDDIPGPEFRVSNNEGGDEIPLLEYTEPTLEEIEETENE